MDGASFDDLVLSWYPTCYRIAVSVVGSNGFARMHGLEPEDLLQEVFIRTSRNWPRLMRVPEKRLKRWFWTVTVNVWRDYTRRWLSRKASSAPAFVSLRTLRRRAAAVPAPEERLACEETRRVLRRLVGTLDRRDARVLTLRFFEDRPLSDIALACRTSESSVSRHLKRAIERLRASVRLHPEFEDDLL